VDGTGSGLFPVVVFGISSTESLGSSAIAFIT
jgi:hypothetical protein